MAKPLPTGIYGIVGVPGSGKSLAAVREMVRTVTKYRRPCYTNVPIRPKKFRAFIFLKLKSARLPREERRAVAQLVKPITKTHFNNFCMRLQAVSDTTEKLAEKSGVNSLDDLGEFQQMALVKRALRIVARVVGEPVIIGRDADWIPPGSVLFLDELHKWYPSKNYKDEDPAIIAFTSMHRHMQLKVFVLTQRWMNASLSFRSMAAEVWFCMNWAKKPIAGFFQISSFINVFRYVHFNGEDIEERGGSPSIGAKPVWSELYCPEWTGAPEYDLYRSHSHVGTLEEQQAEMRGVVESMMRRKGDTAKEETSKESDDDMANNRPNWSKKLNKLFTTGCVMTLAFMMGRCTVDPEIVVEGPEPVAAVVEEAKPEEVAQAVQEPTQAKTEEVKQPPRWADQRLSAVLPQAVIVDGQKIQFGEQYHGLFLVGVDVDAGDSSWLYPEGRTSMRWRVGDVPHRGVLPPVVRDAVREALARRVGTDPEAPGDPVAQN